MNRSPAHPLTAGAPTSEPPCGDASADGALRAGPERRLARKVVGYVVRSGMLLVFTHDDAPLEVTGVQVPAGTIEPGETPAEAVLREVFEETGRRARIVRALGTEHFDFWPAKPELHERHFFQLELLDEGAPERWQAGEEDPSDGGAPQRWTCWWTPLRRAHVLCAGFGARLGGVDPAATGAASEEPGTHP